MCVLFRFKNANIFISKCSKRAILSFVQNWIWYRKQYCWMRMGVCSNSNYHIHWTCRELAYFELKRYWTLNRINFNRLFGLNAQLYCIYISYHLNLNNVESTALLVKCGTIEESAEERRVCWNALNWNMDFIVLGLLK